MGTDIHGVWQKRRTGEDWVDIASKYEQDRHYLLFAWLGDVRNGYGFAGMTTHTPLVPLTCGRGVPEDFVLNDYEDHNGNWMGDHSHSWVNIDEVLSANIPTITRTGVITADEYSNWVPNTQPKDWSVGITGPNIVVSTPDTITDRTTHVRVVWDRNIGEDIRYFTDECQRIRNEYPNDEVRFVFGFDS